MDKQTITKIVLGIMIAIALLYNQKLLTLVNRTTKLIGKIPKVIAIVVTILSLFGLSSLSGNSLLSSWNGLSQRKSNKVMNLDYPNEQGHLRERESEPEPEQKHRRCVSETTKKLVAAKQHWKCGICGQLLDETYEVDHIDPLYQGGSNDPNNLMALDPICHRKKTNSDRLGIDLQHFM